MRKRYFALLSVIAVLAFTSIAWASGTTPDPHKSTRPDVCRNYKHPASEQRQLAHTVFAPKHWKRDHLGKGRRHEIGRLRHCADKKVRPEMRDTWQKAQQSFGRYRLYREVAPYSTVGYEEYGVCNGPPSPADKCFVAIDPQVVCGESGFDFYVNADGMYQIIPSTWASAGGTKYASTAGSATPLQQHIIAHKLWGTTAWYGLC